MLHALCKCVFTQTFCHGQDMTQCQLFFKSCIFWLPYQDKRTQSTQLFTLEEEQMDSCFSQEP